MNQSNPASRKSDSNINSICVCGILTVVLCYLSFSDSSYEVVGDRLPKETLVALSNYKPIQEFIKESDYILYQRLVEVLVPDVLRAVPSKELFSIIN